MIGKRRIFKRRRARRVWKMLVAVLAATVTLSACGPRTSQWSPAESPKENKVDWIAYDHVVRFGSDGATLSQGERQRLARFLYEIEAGGADQIVVSTPPAHRDTRAASVAARLRVLRLRPEVIVRRTGAGARNGEIRVVVGRYIVTPPRCPDWTKPATADFANQIGSNFGCATATNLGVLLVDPGVIVRGRPMGPSDGEAAAEGIESYRKGETEEPINITLPDLLVGGGN